MKSNSSFAKKFLLYRSSLWQAHASSCKPSSKFGVLTDRPPDNPPSNVPVRYVVNTVGHVPMTFGREPNTFPYFAANVLNTTKPSTYEGVQNMKKEIHTSAANYVNAYVQLFAGVQNKDSETFQNHHRVENNNVNLACFTGSTLDVMPNVNKDVAKISSFTASNLDPIQERGVSIQYI